MKNKPFVDPSDVLTLGVDTVVVRKFPGEELYQVGLFKNENVLKSLLFKTGLEAVHMGVCACDVLTIDTLVIDDDEEDQPLIAAAKAMDLEPQMTINDQVEVTIQ